MNSRVLYFLSFFFLSIYASFGQCPLLNDGTGTPSANPYWISCTGNNYTLFLQSGDTIDACTIDWGDGSPIQNSAAINPPNFISHTYTATVDTFVVTITETVSGCILTGVVVMERVPSASIQIPAGGPLSGCIPAVFSFNNNTSNVSETTRFTWNFGDGTPITNYNYTNAGQTITHSYLTGSAANCNTAVTLTAENYCNSGTPSSNIYQPIQIWNVDDPAITATPNTQCFPNRTFLFQNTSTLNCFAMGNNSQREEYWNFGNYWGNGQDSIISWLPFNPPTRPGYTITFPGLGNYNVKLLVRGACGVDSTIITVNVIAPPVASFTTNRDTICQRESITFTSNGTGGNNYTWDFGDGSPTFNTGSTAPVNHTFVNPGPYVVTLIVASGGGTTCRDTVSRNIFVKPGPTAGFSMDDAEHCDSGFVSFTDNSINAVIWNWNFANGNLDNTNAPATQFYSIPGNYLVSLNVTALNGCVGNTTNLVQVFASPQAQIDPPTSVCINTSAFFTESSVTTAGDPVTGWTWRFGDGSPNSNIQNPSHVYSSSGNFNVILSVTTSHCNGINDTIGITVNPRPTAVFNQDTTQGCTALIVNFSDASSGGFTYRWGFGDGSAVSTSQNPSHTFVNNTSRDTIYRVYQAVTNTFGCADTAFQNISTFSASHSSFTMNAIAGCSPVLANFNNTSSGAVGYVWDFGDGSPTSSNTNPSHQFANTTAFLQNYTVKLTSFSANGCRDSTTQLVSVFPKPDYNVTVFPDSMEGCHPLDVFFSASSSGVIYNWNFGDGDSIIAQNPQHRFTNIGVTDSLYPVRLIATNAFFCADTTDLNIIVHPVPIASFTASPIIQKFPESTVSFINTSTGGNAYQWQFGDNITSNLQSPAPHTYTNWGSFDITLTLTNAYNCIDTAIRTITILPPKSIADFTVADSADCRPFQLTFNDHSVYAETYSWDFGDGGISNQASPEYVYHSAGTFTVTLITYAIGGDDTATSRIIVHEKAEPFFTVNPKTVYVPSDPLIVHNLSKYADRYRWDFGDGGFSTEENPVHYYQSKGLYSIKLVALNQFGCIDSITFIDEVSAEERGNIKYPNAFTPSASGPNGGYYDANSFENNVFFPTAEGVAEYHLMIFNRWGELIFESKELTKGWDGYYKGQLCPQDVYVWKVEATLSDGSLFNKAGDVTLLR